VVVAVVTTASHWMRVRRVPDRYGKLVVVIHPRVGGKAAAAVFAHAQPALVGLCLGFLGVHYLAEPIGVWWSFAVGLAITIAWSSALWLLRRARLRLA
jgi:hypothetical protein